jgi:hypothetical protein
MTKPLICHERWFVTLIIDVLWRKLDDPWWKSTIIDHKVFLVVPQGMFWVLPGFPFLVIFGAFYWRFSWRDFEAIFLGICWGSFPFDSPPKSVRKGARFWGFRCPRVGFFLAGILRFVLFQRVLVDHNLAMECPWGLPTIPNVLFETLERIGRSGVGIEGVDPRVLFIPSCPGMAGLTGASDRSKQCVPFVGFASGELLVPCVYGWCCCWSVLGLFGDVLLGFVKVSSSLQVVFWGCLCSRA